MRAQLGDLLLVANDHHRVGLVIGVPMKDGSPPYIVRWRRGGYIAMVYPDHYSRIVPGGRLTAADSTSAAR